MPSKPHMPVLSRTKECNARRHGGKMPCSAGRKGVVYIAGKVGDLTDDAYYYEVVRKFAHRERELRKLGYSVVNPMTLNNRNTDWDIAMRKCIIKLMQSDFISPLSDWKCSPGAAIEVELAEKLGIPKVYPSKINCKYNKKKE
jgi:hypothetical protein